MVEQITYIMSLYLIFALTTALTGIYELFLPVLRRLEHDTKDNLIVEHKWIATMITFLVFFVAAPLTLISCIVPTAGIKFRNSFYHSLK